MFMIQLSILISSLYLAGIDVSTLVILALGLFVVYILIKIVKELLHLGISIAILIILCGIFIMIF